MIVILGLQTQKSIKVLFRSSINVLLVVNYGRIKKLAYIHTFVNPENITLLLTSRVKRSKIFTQKLIFLPNENLSKYSWYLNNSLRKRQLPSVPLINVKSLSDGTFKVIYGNDSQFVFSAIRTQMREKNDMAGFLVSD